MIFNPDPKENNETQLSCKVKMQKARIPCRELQTVYWSFSIENRAVKW